MENYTVEIWEGRTKQGKPDFIFRNVRAESHETALSSILLENNITKKVYAEVTSSNGLDRQKFEEYQLRK